MPRPPRLPSTFQPWHQQDRLLDVGGEIQQIHDLREPRPRHVPHTSQLCLIRHDTKVFRELKSTYMTERAHDIVDIEKRLLRNLLGRRRSAPQAN